MRRLRSQRGLLRASTSSPGITSCVLATATSRVIAPGYLPGTPPRKRAGAVPRRAGASHRIVVVVTHGFGVHTEEERAIPRPSCVSRAR